MTKGALMVDHTTTSAEVAQELYVLAKEMGLSFMDAPVSGGQAGAENGVLTIMCGGDQVDFERSKPVQEAYAQAVTLMGEVGAGQLTKMVNQITFVGAVQAISEGLVFAENAGLNPKQVVDVISKGAAGSWQLSNRGHTMIDDEFNFGFAVDWVRKDLGFALDEARKNGSALPVTGLIDQYYKEVQRMGGGRWDTSSLIKLLRDK
jgi:3-hydroxyisobutyrate dehydrogenase/2-hydroxy-3-oxopropionate reductase